MVEEELVVRWMGSAVVAVATAAMITSSVACGGPASTTLTELAGWVDRTAAPLSTAGSGGSIDDLEPLRPLAEDAVVVGLGESAHGLGDQFTLRHRMARFLVERMGFRTLAWEEDWASGVAVDRYIVDGIGDPREIVGSMVSAWQSEEMLDLVGWGRAYNVAHAEKVRFLGTDLTQLRQLSVDEITRFVTAVAPARVDELRGHLDEIGLRGTPVEHIGWYLSQPDQQLLVDHARAVLDLVTALPAGSAAADRDAVVQHARAVVGFYEYYTFTDPDMRDRFMAETLGWWRDRTGHRVVFWAASVHVAASSLVDYAFPPTVPAAQLVPTGHVLRQRYGPGYVPIAAVFGSGEVLQGWETGSPSVFAVSEPGPGTVDHLLGAARAGTFLLDLHAPAPPGVTRWLDGPAAMRLIGSAYDVAADARYAMTVDSWSRAFDAVVHVRTTSAARLLGEES